MEYGEEPGTLMGIDQGNRAKAIGESPTAPTFFRNDGFGLTEYV